MNSYEVFVFIISLLVMIIGLAGVILPIIPSIPLIWFGAFLYAIFTGFNTISWKVLLIFAALTIFSIVIENLANAYGAKRFGATRWGIIGSFIGAGIGMYFGGIVGLILGPIIGTVVLEVIGGQNYRMALRSGMGNFIGFLGGSIIKLVIGITMICIFVWKVF